MENDSSKFVQPTYHQINLDDIISRLLSQQASAKEFCLTEDEVNGLCFRVRKIFLRQPMLLEINPPVNICGDIHGQFKDLKTVFKHNGFPDTTNYLFLGDYVDRGKQGLQCICLLFAYKIKFAENFFLLRGNHECCEVNKIYGFFDECKNRISIKVWKVFTNCFNYLPVAAVVGDRIFCCHGGLSPFLKNAADINLINRPAQMTKQGTICDILWSDPRQDAKGFTQNYERGVGYYFGQDVLSAFLRFNDFDMVCRSHQVVQQGYQFFHKKKLVTIFSAPNYCGVFDNAGAILIVSQEMLCQIEVFEGEKRKQIQISSVESQASKKKRRITKSPMPCSAYLQKVQSFQKSLSKLNGNTIKSTTEIENSSN